MIVSVGTFLFLYVMVPLAILLGLWLYDRHGAQQETFMIAHRKMVTCDICLHKFYCDRDDVVAPCPQCGSLCKTSSVLCRK